MKKVAVLTTFDRIDPQYSLTSIVKEQLICLSKYFSDPKRKPVFIALEGCEDIGIEGVETRAVIPRYHLTDYQVGVTKKPDFEEQVYGTEKALLNNLKDVSIVFTHDIIFQTWFLPHNQAIRNVAEKLPNIRWYHWIHSAPSMRPNVLEYPHTLRFSLSPNSKIVVLNDYHVRWACEQYGCWDKDVRVVNNPRDPRSFFDMHPLSVELIETYGLLEADVMATYPASMIRGKQHDIIIKIMAKINELGKTAKVVFCNSYANAEQDKKYIDYLKNIAREWGLKRGVVFTSEHDPRYELGVPNQVVRDMFLISNVFINPGKSEGDSLIIKEAALTKNLLVLNEDLPQVKEIYGDTALYFRFSSDYQKTEYLNEEQYFGDIAKIILANLKWYKPMKSFSLVKNKHNRDTIFRDQILSLIYEED